MFERKCPKCDVTITYSSKYCLETARKNNSVCAKCRSSKSGFLDRYATKGKNTGEQNPFYGKSHSEEFKDKLRKDRLGTKASPQKIEKMKKAFSGSKNPMYGKSVFNVWIEKYGLEKALEKEKEWKKKISESTKGEINHRFGKPSPIGSGNGWKGWYKDWFFRSLRELSYMINVIEKNNYIWKTAESRDLMIQYIDFEGKKRNYFADFIINDKEMIEIKPLKLHSSDGVVRKKDAAIKFCLDKGLTYKLIDCDVISVKELKKLVDNNIVVFTDRYKERVNKYFKEHINERT